MPEKTVPPENWKEEVKNIIMEIKPGPPLLGNVIRAFVVGGLICSAGQLILNFYHINWGLEPLDAAAATSATLVFIAAFLTGIGFYDEISRFGGAGGIVPITGFANAMVSPAMEYRAEGLIFGVGARLFTIAGPVLVWGIVASWLVGVLYYFFH